jgi:DNA-binding response OmpR family regulator
MTDPRPKLLIVDDTPANIHFLAEGLAEAYELRAALCGEDALQAVAEDLPDLILLDGNLPGLSGFEVCRRLKEAPATRPIPVIFVTGRDEEEDELEGLQAGAADYITRPFSLAILRCRVQTHLELKRHRELLASLSPAGPSNEEGVCK